MIITTIEVVSFDNNTEADKLKQFIESKPRERGWRRDYDSDLHVSFRRERLERVTDIEGLCS